MTSISEYFVFTCSGSSLTAQRTTVRGTRAADAIRGKSALSKTFLKYHLHSRCGHLLKTNGTRGAWKPGSAIEVDLKYVSSVECWIPLLAAFSQKASPSRFGRSEGNRRDPSATCWWASHQQILSAGSESHGLSASVAVTAPGPQPAPDVTSGEGTFTQAEKEGWDCWVSHSGVLGTGVKSVGSAWPCGFLSFWAGICTSWRSCWVDGICNRFIFPALKILCKLGFYFPFLTAEPRSGGNECVIPLWKHLNRWKGQGRVEREGGESGFRQKSCFLSKNRLKAL